MMAIVFFGVDAETTYDTKLLVEYYGNKGRIESKSYEQYLSELGSDKAIIEHVQAAINYEWIPVQLQAVVALSVVIWTGTDFNLIGLKVPPTKSREEFLIEEGKVLTQFMKIFEAGRPTMYTFNGMRFDSLLIQLRSMVHRIVCSSYWNGPRYNDYRSRYDQAHVDIMDELMNKTGERINLNTAVSMLGFPLKTGIGGADVPVGYHDGRTDEISSYCDVDTILLIGVVIAFKFSRGQVDESILEAFIRFINDEVANGHPLLIEDDYHVKLLGPIRNMLDILKQ